MASNEYHFVTEWTVDATPEEVSDILQVAEDLARWWPSVYLDVQIKEAGDDHGIGKIVGLYTKGWLPYTLRWQFRVIESRYPHGFTLEAFGDFAGRGIWIIEQRGGQTAVTYDWKIEANKPILRTMSFLLKPIFSANHRWAMKMGEVSLKLELQRRRAVTPQDAALVPSPPGPTFIRKRNR
ncbi:MAG: SRPBCC family protein [Blastocatellia bacterium]